MSIFTICKGVWVPFEEVCIAKGTVSEKIAKSLTRTVVIRKLYHDFWCFEKRFMPCGIMD